MRCTTTTTTYDACSPPAETYPIKNGYMPPIQPTPRAPLAAARGPLTSWAHPQIIGVRLRRAYKCMGARHALDTHTNTLEQAI